MNWSKKRNDRWHYDQSEDAYPGVKDGPNHESLYDDSKKPYLRVDTIKRSQREKKHRSLFMRFLFFFLPMFILFNIGFYFFYGLIFHQIPSSAGTPDSWFTLPRILLIVFIMLIAGIGSMAFRRFSSPFAAMMDALDRVAEGDRKVRLSEDFHGEFKKMARSFNRMVEELESAEQRRRNMTADIAHELRTPLHIVQGNLEGILDGVYEPTDEQIRSTLDELHLLTRLVTDLQTLSLAEAGKLHLHFEQVSAADLIEDTVTSFTGLSSEHGIELRSVINNKDDTLVFLADPDRLSQVLNNLVANAIRYTPAGGTITLTAGKISNRIHLEVSDTGIGISDEDLPYVFDRFWKAEPSRTRHEGAGSGLGLAIARQLVQAHGGDIYVESQPGKGTRFMIDLPIKPEY